MARVSLASIEKRYGKVVAVRQLDLEFGTASSSRCWARVVVGSLRFSTWWPASRRPPLGRFTSESVT